MFRSLFAGALFVAGRKCTTRGCECDLSPRSFATDVPTCRHFGLKTCDLPSSLQCSFQQCSSFRTSRLDVKRRRGYLARVGVHRDIHSQSSKSTSNDPAREIKILPPDVSMSHFLFYPFSRVFVRTHCLRSAQRLFRRFHSCFAIHAHTADGLEALVRQDKDAAVVGFQVVDLLAEEQGPEVFADELDAVKRCLGAWAVGAEPANAEHCVSKSTLLSCLEFVQPPLYKIPFSFSATFFPPMFASPFSSL